jgi:protein-L-isoaspartate(D-aspartate) O-methyltransferase
MIPFGTKGPPLDPYAKARERMVDGIRARGIRDDRVLEAMNRIPRHEFVPEPFTRKSYGDHALSIGADQTISQPYMVALMTELLEIGPKSRVLEIGAGSGYQTAVLAALAGQVFAIERIPDLAREATARLRSLEVRNAFVKCFDGTIGWSEHAPYDGVLVAAGGPAIPDPLVAQLAVGGRLVAPIGTERDQRLVRLVKTEGGVIKEDHGGCVFVKLIGRYGWEK